ncbi:hypothetical protein [Prevotella pallens]|uniref:hypothetical protein n=1 Tax=Prevotella pallens TaxID=60133 RepID=UPI0028D268DF|nr:hypothetical protein [Prevotella pallens]
MNTLRTLRECILNGLLIMQRPPTKCVANIPSGVGADSSRPYPYIIKNVYFHNQICVSTLSNMRLHSPFRGCLYIRGHDKSAPTAADGLPIMLQTDCNNVANIPQNAHENTRNTQLTLRKMSTFTHEMCNETLRQA